MQLPPLPFTPMGQVGEYLSNIKVLYPGVYQIITSRMYICEVIIPHTPVSCVTQYMCESNQR